MAGLSAAFELTRPGTAQNYEVTVYQLGWRLGGKGASSRNPSAGHRIEEHGLHLWAGCYENAFRLIRECYEELGRPRNAPLSTWDKAFLPQPHVVLEDHHEGRWNHWPQYFPVLPTRPGESDRIGSPLEMFVGLLRWMIGVAISREPFERWSPPLEALTDHGLRDLQAGLADLVRPIEQIADRLRHGIGPSFHWALAVAVDKLRDAARLLLAPFTRLQNVRRTWLTLDFLATNVAGILAEGFLIPRSGRPSGCRFGEWLENVSQIDDRGYREWLLQHGASRETTEAPMVRGIGDAVFNSNFRGAAGTALNGLLRLNLTYRGALFYRMAAGMGETVFTPLYQVLRRRGVKFRFFHRVDRIELDGDAVSRVVLTEQAKVRGDAYRPLIDVAVPGGALACWRHAPDWSQLEHGDVLRDAGVDLESTAPVPGESEIELTDPFAVVLAVPIAALPPITDQLARRSERWRLMLDNVATTRTQSLQVWYDRTLVELGGRFPSAVTTGYAEALDTWADMTHLLDMERVSGARNLGYFCGSLDDEGSDAAQHDRVFSDSVAWLDRNIRHLLPEASWARMIDPEGRAGSDRLRGQYWKANVRPSDRYTLSLPGTTRYRMTADDSGFDRLFLAGDWCRTGMNVGSIEATVMSGLRAARAISGRSIRILGDVD